MISIFQYGKLYEVGRITKFEPSYLAKKLISELDGSKYVVPLKTRGQIGITAFELYEAAIRKHLKARRIHPRSRMSKKLWKMIKEAP